MNRFLSGLFKIIIFLVLLIVADQVIGRILRKLYFTQKTGPNHSLIYSFRECKSDILVFGASQAVHNYDSRIITDSLKMSCYNAGQDGGHCILMQYAQIKVITQRYSPKILILEFHPGSIVHYPGDYDRMQILSPFYKDYPELGPLILLRGKYERIKLFSAIYPFNSNVINILRFNTNTHAARKKDFEGYVPLEGSINASIKNIGFNNLNYFTEKKEIVDENMKNALINIIKICNDKNINLLIVSSPIFHTRNEHQDHPSKASELSLEILKRYKVTFFDFSYDSNFMGKHQLFKDEAHLNTNGAKFFTTLLINKIKKVN